VWLIVPFTCGLSRALGSALILRIVRTPLLATDGSSASQQNVARTTTSSSPLKDSVGKIKPS
jgi:hypothetical protein